MGRRRDRTVVKRFNLDIDVVELKGYSSADASKFLYLLPHDFNLLAAAIATELEAEASKAAIRQTRSSARMIARVRKTRK